MIFSGAKKTLNSKKRQPTVRAGETGNQSAAAGSANHKPDEGEGVAGGMSILGIEMPPKKTHVGGSWSRREKGLGGWGEVTTFRSECCYIQTSMLLH